LTVNETPDKGLYRKEPTVTNKQYEILTHIHKSGRCDNGGRTLYNLVASGMAKVTGSVAVETSKTYNFGRLTRHFTRYVNTYALTDIGRKAAHAEWTNRKNNP